MQPVVPISICLFAFTLRSAAVAQANPVPVRPTAQAQVLGRVFDGGAPAMPLAGAVVRAWSYPRQPGAPPLAAAPGVSDARGEFVYTTTNFGGEGAFLVEIAKPGYTEAVRRVNLRAGGTWRIEDAFIRPLAAATSVAAASGGTVIDPAHTDVRLTIPAGALQRDAQVTVTLLNSSLYAPDQPPPNIAEGSFVHIGGIPGGQTSIPATLEVPNVYGLPVTTQVSFGRLDSDTVEWQDFTQASPPGTVGVVRRRQDGSTYLEVQISRFSTVGTGMCLLLKPLEGGSDDDDEGGTCNDGPSCDPCNSTISYREGHLGETLALPGFTEFGAPWALELGYSSYSAAPSKTLTLTASQADRSLAIATRVRFQVEGVVADAFYGSSSSARPLQKILANWFWDGRNAMGTQLPTGTYTFQIQATRLHQGLPLAARSNFTQYFGSGHVGSGTYPRQTELRSPRVRGRAVIINQRNSPYGAGWCLLQEPRLHRNAEGRILLTHGNASWLVFEPDSRNINQWLSPAGDYTILSYLPSTGTYLRTFRHGSRQEFDRDGRITRTADRYGHQVIYQHAAGLLTQVTSPTGFFYRLAYDGAGRLLRIDDSAQRTTRFVVDATGDLTQVTDPLGGARRFQYDSEHRLTAQLGARGERTEYHYRNGRVAGALSFDTDGRTLLRERRFAPSALNGEMGEALRLGLGSRSNPIPAVVYEPSIRTSSAQVLGQGRIDQVVDGRGVTSLRETNQLGQTVLAVDGLGRWRSFDFAQNRLLVGGLRPDGATVANRYDQFGNLTLRTEETEPGLRNVNTGFQYDTQTGAYDVLTLIVDAESKRTQFQYDGIGNRVLTIDHDGKRWTTSYGDSRFRQLPTRTVSPTSDITDFTYDLHGNLASATDYPSNAAPGRTTTYTRDAAGNVLVITDPLQFVTGWTYDAWNRVLSRTNALLHTITFEYGEQGCGCQTPNLTRVTFPTVSMRSSITFRYDGLNRLKERTDQLQNTTRYRYDMEGNLISVTNRNGGTVSYQYDAIGKRTRKTLGPPFPELTVYEYSINGDIILAQNNACRLEFTYDSLRRVTSATTVLDLPTGSGLIVPFAHTLVSVHDRVGNRTRVVDAWAGHQVDYAYDNRHRLRTLRVPSLGNPAWTFDYDDSGRRSMITAPGGFRSTYSRDNAEQVISIVHGTTPVLAFTYPQYDQVGNVGSRQIQVGTQIIADYYTYDVARQLQSVSSSLSAGDRTVNVSCVYDAAQRIISDERYDYAHDREGRVTHKLSRASSVVDAFYYDVEGRLTAFTQIDARTQNTLQETVYRFDPLGRRVMVMVNGVARAFVYDRDDILHEADAQGRIEKSFVHGGVIDEPLALWDPVDGTLRLALHDRVGSIVGVCGSSGNLLSAPRTDEFGNGLSGREDAAFAPYGFTSRELDFESGLAFYRKRHYDTVTGRFFSEDPLDISHNNRTPYGYVNNSPLMWRDPFGLEPEELIPRKKYARPQDWVCTTPFLKYDLDFFVSDGLRQCCQDHDACYIEMDCNARSWLPSPQGPQCTKCNSDLINCVLPPLPPPPPPPPPCKYRPKV